MNIRTIQRKIIRHSLTHEADPTYNMGSCIRFRGPLQVDLLKKSVTEIIGNSPIYRYNFELSPDGVSTVERDDRSRFRFEEVDVSHVDERDVASSVIAGAQGFLNLPFDLRRDILIRARLYRRRADDHYVVFALHHGVSDAYSAYSQFRKIAEVYGALQSGAAYDPSIGSELTERSPDVEGTERSIEALRAFISAASPGALDSAPDAPDPRCRRRTVVVLNAHEEAALRGCAARLQVRMIPLSLAHFALVRARVRGHRQFMMTLPFHGRTKHTKELLGCFVNVLPIFIDLERCQTIGELCADLDRQLRLLMRHQHLTIEDHVDRLFDLSTIGALRQIYSSVFTYYSADVVPRLPGVATEAVPLASPNFAYPINWVTWDLAESIHIEINSSTELFQAADLDRHVRAVAAALGVSERIDDILLHGAATPFHQQFFARVEAPVSTLTAEFERQALAHPAHVAVSHRGRQVTYAELDAASSAFADALAARLDPAQTAVIVCMDRGPELIAAILGVLKTGRAYVPVEPSTPPQRVHFILEDLLAPPVVTAESCRHKFADLGEDRVLVFDALSLDGGVRRSPPPATTPQDTAYVIFTSGSTGRPKGVWVSHRNVTRLFTATSDKFGFSDADVWLLFHSHAFDFSVWEIFGALLFGGRLVIADAVDCKDCDKTADLVIRERISVLNQTPTAFGRLSKSILAHPAVGQMALRQVIFGGERLDPSTLAGWSHVVPLERTRLTNMYGITETTVHVTHHDVTREDIARSISNIGRPIDDLSLYVFNDAGTLAEIGQIGEIAVAGAGVSEGYLANPAQTAKVFVPNPVEPSRFPTMYRSGDLACYRGDGTIQYVGRRDKQVQLRGYRVELAEIEAALLQVGPFRACSVGCSTFRNGEQRLIAYCVGDRPIDPRQLREGLAQRLPGYMIPSHYVALASLPMTINGKVDQARLEADFFAGLDQAAPASGPAHSGDLIARVEAMWTTVLGHAVPSHDIGFFDAGGDSLMVNQLAIHLKTLLPESAHQRLSVATLLDRPTIQAQAALIRRLTTPRTAPVVVESRARQRLQMQAFRRNDRKLEEDPTT